jgi:hypothetical protein
MGAASGCSFNSLCAILPALLCSDRDATEIPLYHIEGAIVQKVIDYLTYHMKVS